MRRKPARRSSYSWPRWASRGRRTWRRRAVRAKAPALIGSARGSTLAEGGSLANPAAEEVELGTTRDTVADDLDLVDARGVHGECALNPDAAADPTHGDRLVQATAAHAHDGPFEDLDPLPAAFDDLDRDAHGVTRRNLRDVPELLAFQLLDGVH